MADSLINNYTSTAAGVVDNTTRFFALGNSYTFTGNATEAQVEVPIRDAGDFKNLYTYVSTNTASVSSTITLRKSVADTTLLVTYTSDQTGLKQDSDSVAYAATDEACFEVTVPTEAGTNTITITQMAVQFTPTTSGNCISILTSAGTVTFSSASSSSYPVVAGSILNGSGTTEAARKFRIRGTFTSQDFSSYVSTNARTTNTTVRTRVNGANGAQTFTYTSTQTGLKEDTSNTDALVAGDDYGYQVTTSTGTANIVFIRISSTLVNTANQFIMATGVCTSGGLATNSTFYVGVGGGLATDTTEANVNSLPSFDFTAKELVVGVSTNSFTDTTVFTVRDNGADSSITVSYTSGQTGLKEDTSNTATITGGSDEICLKIVTPNVAGFIAPLWFGLLGETSSGSSIKSINGLAIASVKSINGLAIASVKNYNGLA